MSSTPKYSSVTVDSAEIAALREAEVRAQLARRRERLQSDVTLLSAELDEASSQEYARHLDRAALEALRRDLADLTSLLPDATTSTIATNGRALRRTRQRCTELLEAAQAKSVALALQDDRMRHETDFRTRRQELARLRETVSDAERRTVDEGADKITRTATAEADRMLREGTLADAMTALARAERAERAFQHRFAQHRMIRDRARALTAELEAWQRSTEASRWCGPELREIERGLRSLATARGQGADVDDVRDRLAEIPDLMAERALKDRERRLVVEAARAAFEDLGFLTTAHPPSDPSKDWVVDARHEQGSLSLEIPSEGELRYVPSESMLGYEASGCGDVVQLLDHWRERMATRNVTVGSVRWDEESEPRATTRSTTDAIRHTTARPVGRTTR